MFADEILFELPQGYREVHVVAMRVFQAADFVPQGLLFGGAVGADFVQRGVVSAARTVFHPLPHEFFGAVVGDGFPFPRVFGIEEFVGLAVIYGFVMQGDEVGDGFAARVVIEAPQLFEAGRGGFAEGFADFDFRDDVVRFFEGDDFVHAAEDGFAFRGDESLADAEGVYRRPLLHEVFDEVFVKRV